MDLAKALNSMWTTRKGRLEVLESELFQFEEAIDQILVVPSCNTSELTQRLQLTLHFCSLCHPHLLISDSNGSSGPTSPSCKENQSLFTVSALVRKAIGGAGYHLPHSDIQKLGHCTYISVKNCLVNLDRIAEQRLTKTRYR